VGYPVSLGVGYTNGKYYREKERDKFFHFDLNSAKIIELPIKIEERSGN
jgi:hypothetical protein